MSVNSGEHVLVTDLPDEILEKIMHNLSYDEIAMKRIVCKKFNSVNKSILNRSSRSLLHRIGQCMNDVKATLPRRQSVRSAHPRNKRFEVLRFLFLRMEILMMRYRSYMKNDICCFVAGKVMDEAVRILDFLKHTERELTSSYDVVKDFLDMASMAVEHFKQEIEPHLANIIDNSSDESSNSSHMMNNVTEQKPSQTPRKIHYCIRREKIAVLCVKGQIGRIRLRLHKQTQKLIEVTKRLKRVERKLNCRKKKIKKQDSAEICGKILSHMKLFCESNVVGNSDAENQVPEVSMNQQSSLERKIDNLTALFASIVDTLKQ